MIYYCNSCSIITNQLIHANPATNFTGSFNQRYTQESKFLKHTIPGYDIKNRLKVVSLFYNDSYSSYHNNIINTALSGSIEINNSGQKNVIWITNAPIGYAEKNGITIEQNHEAFKLVLHHDINSIHGFSTGSLGLFYKKCSRCSRPAF